MSSIRGTIVSRCPLIGRSFIPCNVLAILCLKAYLCSTIIVLVTLAIILGKIGDLEGIIRSFFKRCVFFGCILCAVFSHRDFPVLAVRGVHCLILAVHILGRASLQLEMNGLDGNKILIIDTVCPQLCQRILFLGRNGIDLSIAVLIGILILGHLFLERSGYGIGITITVLDGGVAVSICRGRPDCSVSSCDCFHQLGRAHIIGSSLTVIGIDIVRDLPLHNSRGKACDGLRLFRLILRKLVVRILGIGKNRQHIIVLSSICTGLNLHLHGHAINASRAGGILPELRNLHFVFFTADIGDGAVCGCTVLISHLLSIDPGRILYFITICIGAGEGLTHEVYIFISMVVVGRQLITFGHGGYVFFGKCYISRISTIIKLIGCYLLHGTVGAVLKYYLRCLTIGESLVDAFRVAGSVTPQGNGGGRSGISVSLGILPDLLRLKVYRLIENLCDSSVIVAKGYIAAVVTGAIVIVGFIIVIYLLRRNLSACVYGSVYQHIVVLLVIVIKSGQVGDIH